MKVLAVFGLVVALLSGCGGTTTAQPVPSKTVLSAYDQGYFYGQMQGDKNWERIAYDGGYTLPIPGVQCQDIIFQLKKKLYKNYSSEEKEFFKGCVIANRTFTNKQ
jgi:hypothetical protein